MHKYKNLILGLTLTFFIVAGVSAFCFFIKQNDNTAKNSTTAPICTDNCNPEKLSSSRKSDNTDSDAITASKNEIDDENVVPKIPSKKKSENYVNFSEWNSSCDPILVVVNKNNPISANYNAKIIDYKGVKVNSIIKNDLDNMINDAAQLGLKIYPSSGYRSVERQTMLFNNQVSKCKKQGYKSKAAESVAATVVAKPRTSEHHTGLAIDFNGVRDDFYKTKEYDWLIKNASKYGFILRYPKDKIDITGVVYEPWHFRYVGKDFAKEIARTGLCYEEYIELIMKK